MLMGVSWDSQGQDLVSNFRLKKLKFFHDDFSMNNLYSNATKIFFRAQLKFVKVSTVVVFVPTRHSSATPDIMYVIRYLNEVHVRDSCWCYSYRVLNSFRALAVQFLFIRRAWVARVRERVHSVSTLYYFVSSYNFTITRTHEWACYWSRWVSVRGRGRRRGERTRPGNKWDFNRV